MNECEETQADAPEKSPSQQIVEALAGFMAFLEELPDDKQDAELAALVRQRLREIQEFAETPAVDGLDPNDPARGVEQL